MKVKRLKSSREKAFDWIIAILIFLTVFFAFRIFVGQPVVTKGDSMMPTLMYGDKVFVEKVTYLFGNPSRNDIIVFPYPADESRSFIKRVIGLPGDIIDIKDGYFYINGEKLTDPFSGKVTLGDVKFPLTVQPDTYFVLGDNRKVSQDSRYSEVGLVHQNKIIGKAIIRYYPFKDFKLIK